MRILLPKIRRLHIISHQEFDKISLKVQPLDDHIMRKEKFHFQGLQAFFIPVSAEMSMVVVAVRKGLVPLIYKSIALAFLPRSL
jgi:hypothetical protein